MTYHPGCMLTPSFCDPEGVRLIFRVPSPDDRGVYWVVQRKGWRLNTSVESKGMRERSFVVSAGCDREGERAAASEGARA